MNNPQAALKIVETEEFDYAELDKIIDEDFTGDRENLIMMLQAIQRHYNYLPRPALVYLSEKTRFPISRIYGVVTFYSTFSLEPRGKNIISVCLGTACHVRGGGKVNEKLMEVLGVGDAQTTADGEFTLESVRCIGCCSLGPVVKVNEDVHSRVSTNEIRDILDQYK